VTLSVQGDTWGRSLASLPGADQALVRRLREKLWITSCDDLLALTVSESEGHTANLSAAARGLQVDEDKLRALAGLALQQMPLASAQGLAAPAFEAPPMGLAPDAILASRGPIADCCIGLPFPELQGPLPASVDHRPRLRPIRSQGRRGTCVGFGTVASLESHYDGAKELSPQYAYYWFKLKDGSPNPGTTLEMGARLLVEAGTCLEEQWPYDPNPIDGDEGHARNKPRGVEEQALIHRVARVFNIQTRSPDAYRAALAGDDKVIGCVLVFGIPIHYFWFSPPARTVGKIRMPVEGSDRVAGYHAMAIAGYFTDRDIPGGGAFIVRNSWGTGWAPESPLGAGYCALPFAFIAKYGMAGTFASAMEPEEDTGPRIHVVPGPRTRPSGSVMLGSERTAPAPGEFPLGRVAESSGLSGDLWGKPVHLDTRQAQVVGVFGVRGSGKSYTLGVVAENLSKAHRAGVVLFDPMGIFFSLGQANASQDQAARLRRDHALEPAGIPVTVLTAGAEARDIDGHFRVAASSVRHEQWATLFGLDPLSSPQARLLRRVLELIRAGYQSSEGVPVQPQAAFGLEAITRCLEQAEEFQEGEDAPTTSTRAGLLARFRAALSWGLFNEVGTAPEQLCRPGQITVVDVSSPDLDEARRGLVLGQLASALGRMEPGTPRWLLVDEAHQVVPARRATAATPPMRHLARRGPRRGCGLVLATQRPGSTDPRLLDHVDVIFSHQLIHKADLARLRDCIPADVPAEMRDGAFLRALPPGLALVGDRALEDRALLVQVRPRLSLHAGQEPPGAQPVSPRPPGMLQAVSYDADALLRPLRSRAPAEAPPPAGPRHEQAAEPVVVDKAISSGEAVKAVRRAVTGWFSRGTMTPLSKPRMVYAPLLQVKLRHRQGLLRRVHRAAILWDLSSGELVERFADGLTTNQGAASLAPLTSQQVEVVLALSRHNGRLSREHLARKLNLSRRSVGRCLTTLARRGVLLMDGGEVELMLDLQLPPAPRDLSLDGVSLTRPRGKVTRLPCALEEKWALRLTRAVFPGAAVEEGARVVALYPFWQVSFSKEGARGTLLVDARSGKICKNRSTK